MNQNDQQSSIFSTPYKKHLSIWRRMICKFGMCGGFMDHAKDSAGVWWIGLRCATCGQLQCPLKSKNQPDKIIKYDC